MVAKYLEQQEEKFNANSEVKTMRYMDDRSGKESGSVTSEKVALSIEVENLILMTLIMFHYQQTCHISQHHQTEIGKK